MLTFSQIQNAVQKLVPKDKITKVYLFGSYSQGVANEKSDVDLHLYTKNNCTYTVLGSFMDALEKELGVKVDFITNQINPQNKYEEELKKEILGNELLIYEEDFAD